MAILTDVGARNATFLLSEANDWRSRDEVLVDATAAALEPGTILGRVTSSGNFVRHAPGAANGSQNAVAVLMFGIGAGEVAERTVVARDAEVIANLLVHGDGATDQQQADALTALAGVGIAAR